MQKIKDALIYWFYWKWRALKYDANADKGRKKIFEKIKGLEANYFYLGMGSVLKHYRDHDLKRQDMDFVISRADFENGEFDSIINKLKLKPWVSVFVDNKLVIKKYFYGKKIPFELFIADLDAKSETTFHIYHHHIWAKKITLQASAYQVTNYGTVKMPKNLDQYLVEWYGQDYLKPVKNAKFDFTKHANNSNLAKVDGKITYHDHLKK